MTDACRGLPFCQESRAVGVAPNRPSEDLQRHAATVVGMHGFVDLAHAATANETLDPIRPEVVTTFESCVGR